MDETIVSFNPPELGDNTKPGDAAMLIRNWLWLTADLPVRCTQTGKPDFETWKKLLEEKGISEQIEFFHLNKLSSSIVVKVDFDLTMTIAAHNFYRIIAMDLAGFENETSGSLSSKFFDNGGQFKIENDSIIVEMKKKRHLQILMEAIKKYKNVKIP